MNRLRRIRRFELLFLTLFIIIALLSIVSALILHIFNIALALLLLGFPIGLAIAILGSLSIREEEEEMS